MHSLWSALNRISLIKQIIVGLIIGIAVALGFPAAARELSLLGVISSAAVEGDCSGLSLCISCFGP